MAGTTPQEAAGLAQARSSAYGLIATSFRYPDPALLNTVREPARWIGWPDVVRRMSAETAEELDAVCKVLLLSPAGAVDEADKLQTTFVRLFGHTARGACPLYELEYGRGECIQQASELADIAGFYAAFGLEFTDDGKERADHISVECEFMCVLAAKEAHAIGEGDEDHALQSVRDAQRSFLEDHLAQWLPAFCRQVDEAEEDGFHRAVARFAAAFIAADCRRLGIVCGPAYMELRPADPSPDGTMSCGVEETAPGASADVPVQISLDPAMTSRAADGPSSRKE